MVKRIRGERGFTLVELLVVLAILAILIAVVVPNLAGLTGGAKAKAAQTELDIVQTAMDTMIARNEAVTIEARAVVNAARLNETETINIWVVTAYDPATETETTGADTGDIELRSQTHGEYWWDQYGRVTQSAYD
jgi:prepilin-type N-terminal cleavage/methylation domain-containing protein